MFKKISILMNIEQNATLTTFFQLLFNSDFILLRFPNDCGYYALYILRLQEL